MGRSAAVVLAALVVLAGASIAHADGDPASDYLLSQQTFIPPDDGIPASYAEQLRAVVRDANARGYRIRVALIGGTYDMGSVGILYNKPQQYSRFLGSELKFVYADRLLIVMPIGLAVSRAALPAPSEQAVVDRIPAPGEGNGQRLAATATDAVIRLAADAGVIVVKPPLQQSQPSQHEAGATHQTRDRTVIAIAAVVLLALTLALVLRRRTGGAE